MSNYAWTPDPQLIQQSRQTEFLRSEGLSSFEEMATKATEDPGWLWDAVIRYGKLEFYQPYTRIMDDSEGPAWTKWCVNGTTNLVRNCMDRHRGTPIYDKTYLITKSEDGDSHSYSYKEFDQLVCRCAGGLQKIGIGKGDVVGLYMPNLAETLIAYFAVIKLGAIIMPLFSGFGGGACIERLGLAGAKALITADFARRKGQWLPMKSLVQDTWRRLPQLEHLIHVPRSGVETSTRDKEIRWEDLLAQGSLQTTTLPMDAMAPAILHYTSGTTGKPKGCVYTHIGLAAKMTLDHGILTDFRATDRHLCMADIGWMVGSKSATIASLHGGSMVVAEGLPDYPHPARFWRLIAKHRVTWTELSPAFIRRQMRYSEAELGTCDLSSLRIIISGGELWTHKAWHWLFNLCEQRVPILNSAGGTEVSGSILLCDLHHPLKIGAFTFAIPGMGAEILGAESPNKPGELIMRHSSIGLTAGLWQDPERYIDSYWGQNPEIWTHGDLVSQDEDGYWFIHGRSDDIIKISGRRIGPAEIENIIMNTDLVSECAVLGMPDKLNGHAIIVLAVPMDKSLSQEQTAVRITDAIVTYMGKPFRPNRILFTNELPKTRNMKIVRRAIRAALLGDKLADASSLLNPASMRDIPQLNQSSQ